MSTASFVRSFLDFFGGDPPNAGLSSLRVGKGEFTLELSAPRYSPSADTLTYRIRPVGKQGRNLPEKLGPVSLFIDAGGPSWDTRLHLSLATTGNVCKTNGFGDGSTPYVRIPDDSAILSSPHTWIVKPDANEPYEVKVTGSEGILDFGTQVAEGANKNGTTTMVFDWTLSCKASSGPTLWDHHGQDRRLGARQRGQSELRPLRAARSRQSGPAERDRDRQRRPAWVRLQRPHRLRLPHHGLLQVQRLAPNGDLACR
jgi:hypothetical protein